MAYHDRNPSAPRPDQALWLPPTVPPPQREVPPRLEADWRWMDTVTGGGICLQPDGLGAICTKHKGHWWRHRFDAKDFAD